MKKIILILIFVITAVNLNAQTFTYTGTGNWTDQSNWSPNYPGDDGLENANYTINIDGTCTYDLGNAGIIDLRSQLTVAGIFNMGDNFLTYMYEDLYLDGGTITNSYNNNNLGLGFSRFLTEPLPYTISGTGTFSRTIAHKISIGNTIINPGTTSNSGTISIDLFNKDQEFSSSGTEYIFDIYSPTDYDVLEFNKGFGPENVNATPVIYNFSNLTLTINHPSQDIDSNTSCVIIVNGREELYNTFNYTPTSTLINGFMPQLNIVPSPDFPSEDFKDLVVTYLDTEAPIITNCSDLTVVADCGAFYQIPDYTTTTTATDNDTATTITYTQSIPAGVGAKDGAQITITATDNTGNSSSCTFTLNVTEDTLSIPEIGDIESNNIAVYPNPTSNLLFISGLTQPETIDIYNVTGQKILQTEVNANNNSITISQLTNGLYFLKLKDTTLKFIKN